MWHIKKPSGDVYGPVSQQTLQQWAKDGRVAPEDQLSADGSTWTPAPDMKELEMEWLVEFEDGSTYGPVHLLALRDPVRDGTVPLESRIRHRTRDETTVVGAVLLTPLLAWDALRTQQMVEFTDELEYLRGELEDAKTENAAPPVAPVPDGTPATDPAVQEEREALQQEVDALKRDLKDARSTAPATISETAEDQPVGYAELVRNFDDLLDRFKEKSEALQAALNARDDVEQTYAERLRVAEERVGRERQETRKLVDQYAALEQKHLQLLKSYRNLNDRMIQSRAKTETQAKPAEAKPARRER